MSAAAKKKKKQKNKTKKAVDPEHSEECKSTTNASATALPTAPSSTPPAAAMRTLTLEDLFPPQPENQSPKPRTIVPKPQNAPSLADQLFPTNGESSKNIKPTPPTHVYQFPVVGAETDIGRETEKRNAALCTKAATGQLTMDDLSHHTLFLQQQGVALQEQTMKLTKHAHLFHSLLKKKKTGEDMVRTQRWQAEVANSEKKLKALQRDTVRYNLILAQLTSSPAYVQLMQHVKDTCIKTPSGQLVKKNVEDEEELSFEELLEQAKQYDSSGNGGDR